MIRSKMRKDFLPEKRPGRVKIDEEEKEVVKHRVSNYIVKPFTPETLMEKINKIFEGK